MNKKGFSLLELMVVIAIIGILSAVAAPNLMQYKLNKRNKVAHEAANKFFIKAIDHFSEVGGNKTVHPITLDFKWYVLDANIEAIGSLRDIDGVIDSPSALEFKHKASYITYELSPLGVISIKP